jgi:hypothetical protein
MPSWENVLRLMTLGGKPIKKPNETYRAQQFQPSLYSEPQKGFPTPLLGLRKFLKMCAFFGYVCIILRNCPLNRDLINRNKEGNKSYYQ